MTICHLHLDTTPIPHGFRPGINPTTGRPDIFPGRDRPHADQLAAYQKRLRRAAVRYLDNHPPISRTDRDPILFAAVFTHPGPGPAWHTSRRGGDLTTVTRAAEDALTGILYTDDSRIVTHLTADTVDTAAAVDVWIARLDQLDRLLTVWRAHLNHPRAAPRAGRKGTADSAANSAPSHPVISEASTPEACSRSIPVLSSPFHVPASSELVDDSLLDWGL